MVFKSGKYHLGRVISSLRTQSSLSNETITWTGPFTINMVENNHFTNLQLQATSSLGNSITYTIVGGADSTRFAIRSSDKTLGFTVDKDYETPNDANTDNIYECTIRATSTSGVTSDHAFTIAVVNEVITWNSPTDFEIYEDIPNYITILDATSLSANPCFFTISGGADAASFYIDVFGQTSLLYISSPTAKTYVVKIKAYCSGVTSDFTEQTFNITVLPAFTITMTNIARFSGSSQSLYLTATANGDDLTNSTPIKFNAGSTLKSASVLAADIQTALNDAISADSDVTVDVVSESAGVSYTFVAKYVSSALVTNLVVANTSQLYPTIILTEAKTVDGVVPVKDNFTLTAHTQSPYLVNLSPSGSFTFGDDSAIVGTTPPSGFSTTASSGSSVTFTQDTGAPFGTFSIASGNGTIASQQDGVTGVTGIAEVFTLTIGDADGTTTTSNGGSVDSIAGLITAVNSSPTGYSQSAGGIGGNTITWTADALGTKADEVIGSDGSGGSSISVDIQGVDAVTAVQAFVTINVTTVPTFDFAFTSSGVNAGTGTIQGTNFTALTPPTGYSVISGGVANTTAVLEQTTATTLAARYIVVTGTDYASIGTYTDGVTEVLEVHTITPNPFTPNGGTWKPSSCITGSPISYGADSTTISSSINADSCFGAVPCTASGNLGVSDGVVTITQGVGGGSPIPDDTLSPQNIDLTAPEITIAIT